MAEGIKVTPKDAEKIRRRLIDLDLLDRDKKIEKGENRIIFPIKKMPEKLKENFEIVEYKFKDRETHRKFRDYLKDFLDEEETRHVKISFDIVGNIAIVEMPEELERYEIKIANALLEAHKNIKTIFKKQSEIKGEERVRELKFLSGVKNSETLHREHGCIYKLDVSKVYFSPRLSYERQRILGQIKDGEFIVDLFAGVGPFSILFAKNRDVKVYAIDSNPAAFGYLKENIMLNRVAGKVTPQLGDCRDLAPRDTANRVIMNLPKSSDKFLDLAFDVIKEGVIHFYAISSERDLFNSKIEFIKKMAEKKGRGIEILNKRIVRTYSPHRYHIVIDIGVWK